MPVAVMVLIAMTIAPCLLLGAAMPAAAQAKPCRTPCLAIPKPEEKAAPEAATPKEGERSVKRAADAAADKPAERLPPRPRAQVAATPPPARVADNDAGRAAPVRRPAPAKRCTEINMRAAVGEPLSDQDMTYLRSQC